MENIQILKEGLEEIINPIKFMQDRLEEGYILDGAMAYNLSNNANYLQSIAKKALEKYQEYETKSQNRIHR